MAQRFTRAIDEQNYAAADALIRGQSQLNIEAKRKNSRNIWMIAAFDEPTYTDWVVGRRTGRFELTAELVRGGTYRTGKLIATATGITVGEQRVARVDSPPEIPYGPVTANDGWQSATAPILPIQR
jgi:hypothetical protein